MHQSLNREKQTLPNKMISLFKKKCAQLSKFKFKNSTPWTILQWHNVKPGEVTRLQAGFDISSVVTGVFTAFTAVITLYKFNAFRLDRNEIIISHVVKKIYDYLQLGYNPKTPMIKGFGLLKRKGEEEIDFLIKEDCFCSLTYIGGPSSCGKSMTIEMKLKNRKNVIDIRLRKRDVKASLMDALGLKGEKIDLSKGKFI